MMIMMICPGRGEARFVADITKAEAPRWVVRNLHGRCLLRLTASITKEEALGGSCTDLYGRCLLRWGMLQQGSGDSSNKCFFEGDAGAANLHRSDLCLASLLGNEV
jgi:hypothetical protein